MVKQPSVVVIARHGDRFDSANKQWRDNAARPFDTPLSYGGWVKSQILGIRIASDLNALELPTSPVGVGDTAEPPRKKRRIIIHSSPYLRCIQTSVAIVAGLKQFLQPQQPAIRPRSSFSRSSQVNDSSIVEEDEGVPRSVPPSDDNRVQLRIDSFLGEWLNPEYFKGSVIPPLSADLVHYAKDYLNAPAEEIKGAELSAPPFQDFSTIDWEGKNAEAKSTSIPEKTGLRAMAAVGHAMAKRPRNSSFTPDTSNGKLTSPKPVRRPVFLYGPPIPTYSIAPQDAIPIGFVAHARDACIDIDHDWDSQAKPLEWGDGGIFGEEWPSMHKRFRTGFQKMLSYYEELRKEEEEEEEEEEDIIVILVTHQAGCNALIRLLTGAPALHDVATSSLTLAVRCPPQPEVRPARRSSTARRGSLDLGIGEKFEMKIIASTEHLRGPSNIMGLNSPRLGKSPAFASRRVVGPDSPDGFSLGDPLSLRPISGHGLPRSQSAFSYATDEVASPPSGLWQAGSLDPNTEAFNLNGASSSFSEASSKPESTWGGGSGSGHLTPESASLPVRSASQRGLWGSESSTNRSRSPGKRRWTAVEGSP